SDKAEDPGRNDDQEQTLNGGGGEGAKKPGYRNNQQMRSRHQEVIPVIENDGPEQCDDAIDSDQEHSQEKKERSHFGQKQFGHRYGERKEDLIVAAIGENGIPFEDHDKTDDGHGEREKEAA